MSDEIDAMLREVLESFEVAVEFRRFDHSDWEVGWLQEKPFDVPGQECRWQTILPEKPEGSGAPNTLTVPIRGDRLRLLGVVAESRKESPGA